MSDEEVKQQRHKNISRIDQPEKHTHGWYVRVRFNGQYDAAFFSDRMYGGAAHALEEALAHRNLVEQEFGKPRTDRLVVGRSPRNRTGVIGVRPMVKRTKTVNGELREHLVYEVTWRPLPNVTRRTSFSVAKHGPKNAFRRARALRRAKEREMYRTSRSRRGQD